MRLLSLGERERLVMAVAIRPDPAAHPAASRTIKLLDRQHTADPLLPVDQLILYFSIYAQLPLLPPQGHR